MKFSYAPSGETSHFDRGACVERSGEPDSTGTFPILSRNPSFQETIKNPAETAGFGKEGWLKRMVGINP